MKWAIQAKEEEKNKPQTISADGWTRNQRSSQMWWRNEQELLSPEPRTARTNELNGSGGGRGKGIRGPRPFVLVGATNRDKRTPFYPGWCLQPGQKAPVPPLVRLAVGPGTKATYCPGPKGCRDKWSGTKACFVVVNLRTERHPCVLDQSSGGVRSRAESQQWVQVIDLQKLHSHVAVRVREKTIPDRASRPRKACCSFLQAYRVNYSVPFWTYLKLHTCWRIFARVTHEHT